MLVINSFSEYQEYLGKELGTSNWHTLNQQQINNFAAATLDAQWIHTDSEKCKQESPFGSTIAHGYLTLSLIPYLWKQIADIRNVKMEVNYGIENFRFGQPVLAGEEVQLHAKLMAISDLRGITKVVIQATLCTKEGKKPVYTGNVIFLYHFI